MQTLTDFLENDEDECYICFQKIIKNQPYATIDNEREKGKFHEKCLEEWTNKSNNGIFTQDKINSYSLYQGNILIKCNPIASLENKIIINDRIQNTYEDENLMLNNNNTFNYNIAYFCYYLLFLFIIIIIFILKNFN